MKSRNTQEYVLLYRHLCADAVALSGVNLDRDLREIEDRVSYEGLSFLTKTLPKFYKHILMCLENRVYTPMPGFSRRRNGPLPKFCGGLVDGLFGQDGSILTDPDPMCLYCLNTLLCFMYKVPFGHTEEQMEKKYQEYCTLENTLSDVPTLDDVGSKICDNAILLGNRLFKGFAISEMPKGGPGAVAGKEKGFGKYRFSPFDQFAEEFCWEDWLSAYSHLDPKEFESSDFSAEALQEMSPPPARAVCVEKDARGPRLISCEPKEFMWLQQAIGRSMMSWLESHPLTRGHLNFTDQSVNAALALSASKDGKYATLDLQDASDRLTLACVRLLLPSNLVRKLEACRSEYSDLMPDIPLKKFAPMGSACCFPVESVIFWLLAVATVEYETGWDSLKASRHVFVYGDDIIVASGFATSVTKTLELFGMKVNKNKSFYQGPFRESCGCDALNGSDVTAIKLKAQIPHHRGDTNSILSLIEASNLLWKGGFWQTSNELRKIVEKNLRRPLLIGSDGGPLLSWFSFTTRHGYMAPVGQVLDMSWDKDTQSLTLGGWTSEDRIVYDQPEIASDLLPFLARGEKEPVVYGLDKISEGFRVPLNAGRKTCIKRTRTWV